MCHVPPDFFLIIQGLKSLEKSVATLDCLYPHRSAPISLSLIFPLPVEELCGHTTILNVQVLQRYQTKHSFTCEGTCELQHP